jgi:hypothetical protein
MTDYVELIARLSEHLPKADERETVWCSVQGHDLRAAVNAIAALVATTALCEKHKPNGGHRAHCVVCSGMALSAALSKISYLCGPPNEMECGPYDVHADESAVVDQVAALVAERDAI